MADQFFGLTDAGKQRDNNEDTFIAQAGAGEKFIIAGVIDGVGGYSGGEVAAALAREGFLERLNKPSGETIPMIIDCFNKANEKILNEKSRVKEHVSMACVATLAVVDIEHNQLYYGHVGDTRLYLLRDGTLIKITKDQSFVGFLEDSGRLTEEEAMKHPKRNEINQALGFEVNMVKEGDYLETGQSPFLPGDIILLCSDGLTDMVAKAELTAIITKEGTLKEKCRQLIDAANQHGGKDNITAVLVQNNKMPVKHDATLPAANAKKKIPDDNPAKIEPAMDKPATIHHAEPSGSKKSNVISTILAVLALIFLGTSLWLRFGHSSANDTKVPQAVISVVKARNNQELKLQAAIDQAHGKLVVLYDTAYVSPIIISQPIVIGKDSLVIKNKGKIVLQSDTCYNGAAFVLNGTCKSILLDSLVINNFKTGIMAVNNALSLKNIRFVHCTTPVLNAFTFADNKYTSGTLPPMIFKTDSLPVIKKTK